MNKFTKSVMLSGFSLLLFNNYCFAKDNSINLVATDTKRLAIMQIEQPTEHNFTLIIPKKAISEIQKLFFDNIEIFYDENTLIANSAHFTFYTKLINGKFPDYARIIPKNKNYRILKIT